MSAISRFEKFAPVDFNEMPITVPDVGLIDSLMGQLQGEYDAGVSKISEATFKNLGADAIEAQRLRKAQNQMIDDITDKYVSSIGEGRSAMGQGLRDLSRDYKEGGQRYAINKNYESFMAQRAELQKRVGKGENQGGITQAQMDAWESYTLGEFGKKGGTTADQYGIWSGIELDDVAKYVNGTKRALEVGKGWMANAEKKGYWRDTNGKLYKKTTRGKEEVSYEEIMPEIVQAMANDEELVNYLDQFGKHSYNPADLTTLQTKNSDGSYSWNMDNPLVRYAQTAAEKFSYLKTQYDEDIKLDPEYILRLKWGREDEKELKAAELVNTTTLGANTTRVGTFETLDEAKSAISKYNASIAAYEEQLTDKNASPSQLEAARENLQKALSDKKNVQAAIDEAIKEVAPEYNKLSDIRDARLKNLNISQNEHDRVISEIESSMTTTEQVSDPNAKIAGLPSTRTITKRVPLNSKSAEDYAKLYAEKTGIPLSQAKLIIGGQALMNDLKPNIEKAVNRKIEAKSKESVSQVMIKVDQDDRYRAGNQKGLWTQKALFEQQIRQNADGFTMTSPDFPELQVVQGQDGLNSINKQYDGKMDFTKMIVTDFIPGSDYMADGKRMSSRDKAIVSVPVTDDNGTRYVQIKVGFTEATKRFGEGIAQDILQYSNDQDSKDAVMTGEARKITPDGAYKRMEQNAQKKVNVYFPLQPGQNPTKLHGYVELEHKPKNDSGKPDAYLVNIGGVSRDFGTDYGKAEKFANELIQLGLSMQRHKTAKEAINHYWKALENDPDNDLSYEDLTKIVNTIKK